MEIDDPSLPEFASWNSYSLFAQRVRHERRYVFSPEITAFLQTVLATNKGRERQVEKGVIFFRAQSGIDWRSRIDDNGVEYGEEPSGHGQSRMKPRAHRSTEGRANAAGIPYLYLGTTIKTAISETRAWIGAEVSVAQFKVMRSLKVLDLSVGHGKSSLSVLKFSHLLGEEKATAEIKEKAVWLEIDNAFSRPITRSDDLADYVPTQILSELFQDAGYDGVVYKSQFDEKGFNIALFDIEAADIINCAPYMVEGVDITFQEIGNPWYATKHLPEKSDQAPE